MKEELIKFETAVLAKEKGFDEHCDNIFDIWKGVQEINYRKDVAIKFFEGFIRDYQGYKAYRGQDAKDNYLSSLNNKDNLYVLRPSQSILQRWLREEHALFIHMQVGGFIVDKNTFYCNVFEFGKNKYKSKFRSKTSVYNYEEALEVGLMESLKLIKNNEEKRKEK